MRSELDRLWDRMWAGGLTNPATIIDQLACLLYLRQLDDNDVRRLRDGETTASVFQTDPAVAWSAWRTMPADKMLPFVRDRVFPWLRDHARRAGEDLAMFSDSQLAIKTPELLDLAVRTVDRIGSLDADTPGDVFEHILSKLAVAGHLGQFRTPTHIVSLVTGLVDPKDAKVICDPAVGTAGFLIAAHRHSPQAELVGWDVDPQMLRIASMNLNVRSVANYRIAYRNTLTETTPGVEADVVLANPPFAGTVDGEALEGFRIDTKKSELLFLDRIEAMLADGGRAGVIVPDGVVSARSRAHREIRELLVTNNRLEAVISLPGGVFRPYTSIACSILIWTKSPEATKSVWMYRLPGDGYTLDDRREPTGGTEIAELIEAWAERRETEHSRNVPVEEIERSGWVLTPSRYLASTVSAATTTDTTPYAAAAIESIEALRTGLQRLKELAEASR